MDKAEYRLIKKCKRGNLKAFEELIKKYEKKSYAIALKILKDPDDAMDISQEALIKVYKSIKTFKFKSSFSTWLYRIVTNTCMDFLRKNRVETCSIDKPIETEDGQYFKEIEDFRNNTERKVDENITKELVHKAIGKLDDLYRVAIILRDIEGFSYKEISEILDCSLGTVKSRINRGRRYLKNIIIEEMEQNNATNV